MIDHLVDYSATHGGPPAPWVPWLFFIAAVRQHSRIEARQLLCAIEGPATALAAMFGEGGGEQQLRLRVLERVAYGNTGAPLTTAPPSGLVGVDGRPLTG